MKKKNLIFVSLLIFSCTKGQKINNNELLEKNTTIKEEETTVFMQNNKFLSDPIDAFVFSDNVNVRNAPNLGGQIIKRLNSGDIITIYDDKTSGEFIDGIWDRWYKISNIDELWINAYYVAHFPIWIIKESFPEIGFLDGIDNLKRRDFTLLKSIKDDSFIRQKEFAFQMINGPLGKSLLDNLDRFEYSFDVVPDYYPIRRCTIVIDAENNVEKKLFYDIKIGDSLESLSEKIGITEFPAVVYISIIQSIDDRPGGMLLEIGQVNIHFYGESLLEKISWELISNYYLEGR